MYQNRLVLIKDFFTIFKMKEGAIVKNNKNVCYKVKNWISIFFKFYYYSGSIFFVYIFMFLLLPHLFENLFFQIIESAMYYIILELFLVFIIPLEKVKCWEK